MAVVANIVTRCWHTPCVRVCACVRRTVALWDVRNRRLIEQLGGHVQGVNCVAFHPNGVLLASGSDDRTVRPSACMVLALALCGRSPCRDVTASGSPPACVAPRRSLRCAAPVAPHRSGCGTRAC